MSGKNPEEGGPFILTASAAREMLREMGADSRTLFGRQGKNLKAILAHESDQAPTFETHDGADDVFLIQDGAATITMGGELVDPVEVSPGEWRGTGIRGGRHQDVSAGDLVIVPRGTPHARASDGRAVSLVIIKVA